MRPCSQGAHPPAGEERAASHMGISTFAPNVDTHWRGKQERGTGWGAAGLEREPAVWRPHPAHRTQGGCREVPGSGRWAGRGPEGGPARPERRTGRPQGLEQMEPSAMSVDSFLFSSFPYPTEVFSAITFTIRNKGVQRGCELRCRSQNWFPSVLCPPRPPATSAPASDRRLLTPNVCLS